MKTQIASRLLVVSLALLGASVTGCLTPSLDMQEVRLQPDRPSCLVLDEPGTPGVTAPEPPPDAQHLSPDALVTFTLLESTSGALVHVSSANLPEGDDTLFGAADVPLTGAQPIADTASAERVYLLSVPAPKLHTQAEPLPGSIKPGGDG